MIKTIVGVNDLATTHPELAKQWHPKLNGNLKPTDVTAGSGRNVWWLFPYDDPNTGKHFDFVWRAQIGNRIRNILCPFLTIHGVWPGFNDLATTHPELAKQWHPTLNGDVKPTDVMAGSGKDMWWIFPYDDPETGKHYDFVWDASIRNRIRNNYVCPFLNGQRVWPGFNDLATTHPELAKQWHPTLNGNLKPTDVSFGSTKKIWWLFPYDDPKTGKHWDFVWQAVIYNRLDLQCPFLTGHAVWPGFNDLATTYPEIAKQWHPTKNGKLKPTEVTASCGKEVWFLYPYDDSKTGKHFDFVWKAKISTRTRYNNTGCPYLSGQRVWVGFNDLATTYPEIAKQWHPTKNGNLKPTDVTAGCNKKVWWICEEYNPKTKKMVQHEWASVVSNRTIGKQNCPYFKSSRLERLTNSVLQEIAKEFEIEYRYEQIKKYRYDVCFDDGKKVIELDGVQHFQAVDFFGGVKHFKETQVRDTIKDDFCTNHNIQLLRIPYIYDADDDKEKIVEFVKNFAMYGTIPEEIKQFYASKGRTSYINHINSISQH